MDFVASKLTYINLIFSFFFFFLDDDNDDGDGDGDADCCCFFPVPPMIHQSLHHSPVYYQSDGRRDYNNAPQYSKNNLPHVACNSNV